MEYRMASEHPIPQKNPMHSPNRPYALKSDMRRPVFLEDALYRDGKGVFVARHCVIQGVAFDGHAACLGDQPA